MAMVAPELYNGFGSQEAIRAHNMRYLDLDAAQYDEHQRLWGQKMTEWPPELWRYVYRVQRKYGMCGEVISSSIADWLRGTGKMTTMEPSDWTFEHRDDV